MSIFELIEKCKEKNIINDLNYQELIDEYEELTDDSLFLNCLENNGVDNWTWYSEAYQDYLKEKGENKEDD